MCCKKINWRSLNNKLFKKKRNLNLKIHISSFLGHVKRKHIKIKWKSFDTIIIFLFFLKLKILFFIFNLKTTNTHLYWTKMLHIIQNFPISRFNLKVPIFFYVIKRNFFNRLESWVYERVTCFYSGKFEIKSYIIATLDAI